VRTRLDASGVRLFEGSAGWITADFRTAQIDGVLETLAALEARAVALVGWDPDRARLVANFAAICDAARGYGLRVHLEFMPYSAIRTLADALAVLDAAAQPNAAVIVDALHLARSGGDPDDVRGVDPRRIASVQLCDAPLAPPSDGDLRRESVTTRRLPGEGELPLRALLDALPADVVVEAEIPMADRSPDLGRRARCVADALRRFVG
jgi:sugar phosphate isomerase/epimerase